MQQANMWSYLKQVKPLMTVMAPTCRPFGGWSHFNRRMHPEAWERSLQQALPHAVLCSEVAKWQMQQNRYFVVEQPETSDMWTYGVWPEVLEQPVVEYVCFDQCQVGLLVEGCPAKKPTVLVSNSPEVIGEFEGLRCTNRHQHLQLEGGARTAAAQVWPHGLCMRIVAGIRKLKRRLKVTASERYHATSSTEAPVDPPDSGGASGSAGGAPERKPKHKQLWTCPACRRHLNRDDSTHTRNPDNC
eukprot:4695447-Amphidinium_carterae.1